MIKILLYYKYVEIPDPAVYRAEHIRLCTQLDITGRVIISPEGINATVGGEKEAIEKYKAAITADPLFSDIAFKESTSEEHVFKKLSVKIRPEIVSLKTGTDIVFSNNIKGKYIEPKELQQAIEKDEEVYIVDVRNTYESYIGRFKNSIALDIDNFRDLPTAVEKIKDLKDKKVVTVCTGGVRCEKASAYLLSRGFSDVSQLHGGIITYGEAYPDAAFEGKCYVFDSRISVDINTPKKKKIIAECYHCHKPCDRYINCCNAVCNRQFVCCSDCDLQHMSSCCDECKSNSRFAPCLEKHIYSEE
jgi:UPF0176 protein